MGQQIVTADAFTGKRFAGNPAAVCVLGSRADEAWMKKVAMEMNLPETAFLVPRAAEASFDIRWFTPTGDEVALCGHATIASSHVLWTEGHVKPSKKLTFHSKSGPLAAERKRVDGEDWIELDFPSLPDRPRRSDGVLKKALGVSPRYVGSYGDDLIAELEDESTVRKLSPDYELLKTLKVRGVAVTAEASRATKAEGYDCVSRFFAPGIGINEDPVTGSAHCCIGPYWAERLGKKTVVGYQASARGGVVRVRVDGDRVGLGGQAVTVLRGEMQS